MYNIVKRFYDRGIYNEKDVAKFVAAGKITKEEFKKITNIKGEYNELEQNEESSIHCVDRNVEL